MLNHKEINAILQITKSAGDIIMDYYLNYKDSEISLKKDDSAVTKADLEANAFIIEKLHKLFPSIPIVSEENKEEDNIIAARNDTYFIIDPLDGTSAFIKKSDEFTVNISLIKNQKPVLGIIYLPAMDVMYFTDEGHNARKVTDFSREPGKGSLMAVSKNKSNLTVICTKREPEKTDVMVDLKNRDITVKEIISISSSYKFCLIAEGKADFYPRRVRIKAWDVAAGHAIVNSAGGSMLQSGTASELEYNLEQGFDIPMFEARGF